MVRLLKIGAWLAAVLALWVFFAPVQLGGRDRYMITDGVSMIPTIRAGALVVVKTEPSYHVGEIVAYRNAQLDGAIILHRIVAIKNGHYTFKGDNNPYPDLDRPTKAALLGKEWIYSPPAGRIVTNLRVPWAGALLLGAFGTWAFFDVSRRPVPRRRRRRRAPAH